MAASTSSSASSARCSSRTRCAAIPKRGACSRDGGHYLLAIWDRIERNPLSDDVAANADRAVSRRSAVVHARRPVQLSRAGEDQARPPRRRLWRRSRSRPSSCAAAARRRTMPRRRFATARRWASRSRTAARQPRAGVRDGQEALRLVRRRRTASTRQCRRTSSPRRSSQLYRPRPRLGRDVANYKKIAQLRPEMADFLVIDEILACTETSSVTAATSSLRQFLHNSAGFRPAMIQGKTLALADCLRHGPLRNQFSAQERHSVSASPVTRIPGLAAERQVRLSLRQCLKPGAKQPQSAAVLVGLIECAPPRSSSLIPPATILAT